MPLSPNEQLIAEIRARGANKATEFNYGIRTADAYVKTLRECVGSDLCYRYASTKSESFEDLLRKSAQTLTYCNDDMVVEEKATDVYAKGVLPDGIVLPKNTLMVFKHTLSTPKKDRDGDILRTHGAKVDQKMLLLWQHVHTLPIGKYLGTALHNSKTLDVYSAIVDMNELSHDAAVMVDNDMGRFSHGFRALEFDKIKEERGGTTSGGFDVKSWEMMEESLVSVPSNTDAETQEVILSLVEGHKLTSPIMKGYGQQIREKRSMTIPVNVDLRLMLNGKSVNEQHGSGTKGGGAEGCQCSGAPKETNGNAGDKDTATDAGSTDDAEVKAKKGNCPTCDVPLNEDGICEECGYGKKTAVNQSEADANNDMGVVLCPTCGTVALEDGKCPKCGATPTGVPKSMTPDWKKGYVSGSSLTGSWENIQSGLYEKCTAFVKQNGVLLADGEGRSGYAYVMATYEGNALVAVNQPDGETSYYRAEWKMHDGEPKFVGTLKEVRVKLEASIIEKAISLVIEKAGRMISSKNKTTLSGVKDGIQEVHDKELLMSKGGKAICRESVKALSDILAADEPPEEVSVGNITAKDAMAEFLAKATSEERSRMTNAIKTLDSIDAMHAQTKEIRALVSR